MQTGGELAGPMWRTMIDNAERYAGRGRPRPNGQAEPGRQGTGLLPRALSGGGAFLLYLQLRADSPTDLRAVLHDYARDMICRRFRGCIPGLLTDSTVTTRSWSGATGTFPSRPCRHRTRG